LADCDRSKFGVNEGTPVARFVTIQQTPPRIACIARRPV
jgi:hypothetical protein